MAVSVLRKIRHFVWGEIPESKAERRLLLKIDWFILSYCCLMVRSGILTLDRITLTLRLGSPAIHLQYFTNCAYASPFAIAAPSARACQERV